MLRTCLPAVVCLLFAGIVTPRADADALADIAKYSTLPPVDLASLAGGKVVTARGPSLGTARDLAVEAVYLVHAPLARALDMHKNWDAVRHPELKVYLHRDFSTHPTAADFAASIPDNSAVNKLAAETDKLPNAGELQLSKAEAASFKKGGGGFSPAVRDFWSKVLFGRASAFLQHGLSGVPPYDTNDGPVRAGDEVSRLLREQPNVRAAFRPLIDKSPLGGGTGSVALAPYWELINEEGDGVFTLGAACSVQAADSAQLLDLQYYASGGFYAYLTFYQMWPVTVNGQAATLVWRVDSISTQSIADLGPIDRMGSGSAMMAEIRRIITLFQKDIGR